jgi:hypothetical protein
MSGSRDNRIDSYDSQAKVAERPMPTPVVIRHPLNPAKDSGTPISREKAIQIAAGALKP